VIQAITKPLRAKDRACLEAWIEGGSLVDAYRVHVARDPDSPHARQSAHGWAQQPHIKAALDADSLPAALGATMALSKLFQDSVLSGLTKLNMLKLWTDIQGELMIPEATKRRIAETILAGEAI